MAIKLIPWYKHHKQYNRANNRIVNGKYLQKHYQIYAKYDILTSSQIGDIIQLISNSIYATQINSLFVSGCFCIYLSVCVLYISQTIPRYFAVIKIDNLEAVENVMALVKLFKTLNAVYSFDVSTSSLREITITWIVGWRN